MYLPNFKVRLKQIDAKLAALKTDLASCPEGSLRITKRGPYFSYKIKSPNGPARYLSKRERGLARDLAYKKYLELMVEDLGANKQAILNYQAMFPQNTNKATRYLFENEGAGRLLKECFPIRNAPLAIWAGRPEATSAPHQEMRVIECLSGHMVRSKSEAMIDNSLFAGQLAFRYEDPLTLGTETIHPDFAIRHPQTGVIIYWEHFGMMDKPKYIMRATHTLELYARHGYVPFQNLIVSFETENEPLDAAQINMVMDYFF